MLFLVVMGLMFVVVVLVIVLVIVVTVKMYVIVNRVVIHKYPVRTAQ